MKKFQINPISIIVWIWLIVMNGLVVAMSYLMAILIHEFGHFFTAKKLGYKVSKFSLSPYGVELSYFNQDINCRDELFIALAGPFANLLSVVFVVSLWWLFPTIYFFSESFVSISFVIAIFNLLPAYPLDGGRIFIDIASNFVTKKRAIKISYFFNFILASSFFVLFLICLFINFNPSLILFSMFLLVGVMDLKWTSKFEKISAFTKSTKSFSKALVVCVDEQVSLGNLVAYLETSKTIVFCVVLESGKVINFSEKMVKNLALNFPYQTKLKEIIK